MIRALQPIQTASYGGPTLMKLAEQGLGVPARQETLENSDYTVALQRRIDVLLDRPAIRSQLNDREVECLNPLPTSADNETQYPVVDANTCRILLRLIWIKDQELAVMMGEVEKAEAHFVPLTIHAFPYFSLLQRLEWDGVISWLTEDMNTPYGMNAVWKAPQRYFSFDQARLSALIVSEPKIYQNAFHIISEALYVDADAENLLPYFKDFDEEYGPRTLKI